MIMLHILKKISIPITDPFSHLPPAEHYRRIHKTQHNHDIKQLETDVSGSVIDTRVCLSHQNESLTFYIH